MLNLDLTMKKSWPRGVCLPSPHRLYPASEKLEIILLENYFLPRDIEAWIGAFVLVLVAVRRCTASAENSRRQY